MAIKLLHRTSAGERGRAPEVMVYASNTLVSRRTAELFNPVTRSLNVDVSAGGEHLPSPRVAPPLHVDGQRR